MRNLNVDPETLFKALFLAQLPSEVRRILASSKKTESKTEASRLTNELQANAIGDFRMLPGQHHAQNKNQRVNT